MIKLNQYYKEEKSMFTATNQSGSKIISLLLLSLLLVQLACLKFAIVAEAQQRSFYARPGVSPAEILRARGYRAAESFITTTDGYVLKVTRGTNPLINQGNGGLKNRVPILFIHGILEDPVVFLINSFYAQPKDYSSYNLTANIDSLVYESSANSLPFMAMNFGHEVWFLARRGAPGSQRKVSTSGRSSNNARDMHPIDDGDDVDLQQQFREQQEAISSLSGSRFSLETFITAPGAFANLAQLPEQARFSFDRDFWNFTFDEQAAYDVPLVIDYCLQESGYEKLAIVSHSAGGAITLMSLSLYPELARKISTAVLWSHGFSLGRGDAFSTLLPAEPFLETYIGSIPPAYSTTQIQALLGLICATALTQRTLCETTADLFLGASGGKEPIYPEFINSLLYPTGSHELAQNIQNVRLGGIMHKYDHGPEGNRVAYGQPLPPAYDASRIKLRDMSFYVGATDALVTPADVTVVLPLLSVPYKFNLIKTTFNHQGYFYHDDNARLVIIPSLRDIQSSS